MLMRPPPARGQITRRAPRSRSENGRRTPAISDRAHAPLPASRMTSPDAQAPDDVADRSSAIGDDLGVQRPADFGKNRRMASRFRCGLSLVMTTRSARRVAISPISGRLPRSRSPPQPKTRPVGPPRSRYTAQAINALSRASGVRVIDDDQRFVPAHRSFSNRPGRRRQFGKRAAISAGFRPASSNTAATASRFETL